MGLDVEEESTTFALMGIEKEMQIENDCEDMIEYIHPLLLTMKVNSEDNPNLLQAMNSSEVDLQYAAMEIEFNKLVEINAWEEVKKEDIGDVNKLDST